MKIKLIAAVLLLSISIDLICSAPPPPPAALPAMPSPEQAQEMMNLKLPKDVQSQAPEIKGLYKRLIVIDKKSEAEALTQARAHPKYKASDVETTTTSTATKPTGMPTPQPKPAPKPSGSGDVMAQLAAKTLERQLPEKLQEIVQATSLLALAIEQNLVFVEGPKADVKKSTTSSATVFMYPAWVPNTSKAKKIYDEGKATSKPEGVIRAQIQAQRYATPKWKKELYDSLVIQSKSFDEIDQIIAEEVKKRKVKGSGFNPEELAEAIGKKQGE